VGGQQTYVRGVMAFVAAVGRGASASRAELSAARRLLETALLSAGEDTG